MGDEDRFCRKIRGQKLHAAEPLITRCEEDVVRAAVPLPEIGHGAPQMVRSHLDISVGAIRVAGLTVGCKKRHEEEVSRVWVERAYGGVAE